MRICATRHRHQEVTLNSHVTNLFITRDYQFRLCKAKSRRLRPNSEREKSDPGRHKKTMSTSVRKQAPRPARPVARYWRGKAPQGVAELSESEDEDETGETQERDEEEGVMPLTTVEGDEEDEEDEQGQFVPVKQKAVGKMNIALKDVDIKEGKVIVAGREESGRTAVEGKHCLTIPTAQKILTL